MDPSRAVLWLSSTFGVPCAMCQWLKEPLASPCSHTGLLGTLSSICLEELVYLEPFGCLCWNELPGHKMCFPRAAPLPPASLWSTELPLPRGNAAVIDPHSPNCFHIHSDDAEHLL